MTQFYDENEIEVRPMSAMGATPDELAPLFDECDDRDELNPFENFVPSEISDAQFLSNLNEGRQREKLREVSEASEWLDIFGDEPMPVDVLTLNQAWGELQATPNYVERDLSQVRLFIETHSDDIPHIEDDLRTGDIPLVPVEDMLVHSDDRPFCDDLTCACKMDDDLFDEYILSPVLAGLMGLDEALSLYNGEHI